MKVKLSRDGDQWCATLLSFVDLQTSPAGFGDTHEEALKSLNAELGKNYKWEIVNESNA